MKQEIIDKIYAGFLGMNIGIRLGAPVEPVAWDYERIKSVYGEIDGYLKNYKNFAADDDVNGPVYFLRALTDGGVKNEFTAEQVGEAWLNYARNGIGMFWWGGYGVSTEHTAYLNLKNGIPAPESGSSEKNGIELSEQIGGQIFIDTWGFIWPGNPQKAAEYAMKAASVSHDGNGLYGAAFMAACIAAAFEAESIEEIIRTGLKYIPDNSTYSRVIRAVCDFHSKHPESFHACMEYLIAEWGYDKYGGVCHIIPNAGVCALSLLYGEGSLARTVEIASMCGWDTDCNAGNVGSIVGVYAGLDGVPGHYREPINDALIVSGISGSLNILDIPSFVKELAQIACLLTGDKLPENIKLPNDGEILFDFELPGSTHGIRLSNEIRFMKRHSFEKSFSGKGSLEIIVDRILPADKCRVYYKPFYRREDFNDERYKPVFSPTVYSGQRASMQLYPELWLDGILTVTPYIETAMEKKVRMLERITLVPKQWNEVSFFIPDTYGDQIAEIGFVIEVPDETSSRVFGRIWLDDFSVYGDSEYSVDMKLQAEEFAQITPFSFNDCKGSLCNGRLHIEADTCGQAFTGNYYGCEGRIEATMIPISGNGSSLVVRGMGARNYYSLGFASENRIRICRTLKGKRSVLAEAGYSYSFGKPYRMRAEVYGNKLILTVCDVNGIEKRISADIDNGYGMIGFAQEDAGSCEVYDIKIKCGLSEKVNRI